jgi:hypothetical protein
MDPIISAIKENLVGKNTLPAYTMKKGIFEILACISDNYLRLTTAHTQILQHYPPSPPQGGDGFDHYIFIGYKYWVRQ